MMGLGYLLCASVVLLHGSIVAALSHNSLVGRDAGVTQAQAWASALAKAQALVKQMTPEEQNNITYGYSSTTNGCSGNSGSAPRVGFPGMCLNDAAAGVRATDFVNAYAAGISVGASWNTVLANTRAQFMGAEFKRKGVSVALGPVVEPLGRVALGGRNWESFGADPYLQGQLAASTVQGLQQSVISSVKHFIGYEQETNRNPAGQVQAVSSNVNNKDTHEMYLWPFQDAVHAGAACVMSSYNRVNGTYASENGATQNNLLKHELNFPGFVLSDFGAQHSGIPSAAGGLDMAMPSSPFWDSQQLSKAASNGSLPASRLEDMATRIVAAWYSVQALHSSDFRQGAGMPKDLTAPHAAVDGRDPAAKPALLQSAVEAHVLVKNINNALPLRKPKMLSLYGYDATVPLNNYPSNTILSYWQYGLQSVNISLSSIAGLLVGTTTNNGLESATRGTIITGGGSGSNVASYWSDPHSAIQARAYDDDTFLLWDFQSYSPYVNPESDACLVFINEFATEILDRAGLADPMSDTLVENVASKCKNTIVVIHNAGIRLVDAWIGNPNITAVMYAHLPGQDSGRALVSLLYGDVSPSGRLPYTVAKTASDYGPLLNPSKPTSMSDTNLQSNLSNPSEIDYRYFLANNISPRYAFGYGMTYSNFGYGALNVSWIPTDTQSAALHQYPPKPHVTIPGGISSLFDPVASVSFTLRNTGSVAAAEVPQIYIRRPGETVQVLRGFAKELLQPHQTTTVTMQLRRKDLSTWDVVAQQWALTSGTYQILVGASVNDIKLVGSLVK